MMSGIYIHIPFCKQACHYCNFHFSTTLKLKEQLLQAILKEIVLQKELLQAREISSIYIGGGTPSLLSYDELSGIFEELGKYAVLDSMKEITLEANPEDMSIQQLEELSKLPINRLSIGVQSFRDDDLQFLNRGHTAKEAIQAIANAKEAGFFNISIDLIYGIPTLSNRDWQYNLDKALSLAIPHISAYCLTVEPKTALAHFIKTKKAAQINEELAASQFELLMEQTAQHDYLHYEISNFCKAGFEAVHNSSYWTGKEYVGIGPSAHSYLKENGKPVRQWNVANNARYIQSIAKGVIPAEQEVLTKAQQYNEYLLTSFRTVTGSDIDYVKNNFGKDLSDELLKKSQQYISTGLMLKKDNAFLLTGKGKLIADNIIADLFIEY